MFEPKAGPVYDLGASVELKPFVSLLYGRYTDDAKTTIVANGSPLLGFTEDMHSDMAGAGMGLDGKVELLDGLILRAGAGVQGVASFAQLEISQNPANAIGGVNVASATKDRTLPTLRGTGDVSLAYNLSGVQLGVKGGVDYWYNVPVTHNPFVVGQTAKIKDGGSLFGYTVTGGVTVPF